MIDLKSTHVYREIHEQPYVLGDLLQEERGAAQAWPQRSNAGISSMSSSPRLQAITPGATPNICWVR